MQTVRRRPSSLAFPELAGARYRRMSLRARAAFPARLLKESSASGITPTIVCSQSELIEAISACVPLIACFNDQGTPFIVEGPHSESKIVICRQSNAEVRREARVLVGGTAQLSSNGYADVDSGIVELYEQARCEVFSGTAVSHSSGVELRAEYGNDCQLSTPGGGRVLLQGMSRLSWAGPETELIIAGQMARVTASADQLLIAALDSYQLDWFPSTVSSRALICRYQATTSQFTAAGLRALLEQAVGLARHGELPTLGSLRLKEADTLS